MSAPDIALIVTSHSELGVDGRQTGFWLEEAVGPYFAFRDLGCSVSVLSPKGGKAPLDATSLEAEYKTLSTERFWTDTAVQGAFEATNAMGEADPDAFAGAYCAGGHGTMWDFPSDPHCIRFLQALADRGKPLASVCHGVAALVPLQRGDGAPLVRGRHVTAFTDFEERAVGLAEAVPFLLETRLREQGAWFHAAPNFTENVVVDGALITGQNPASAPPAARRVVEFLR